MVETNLCVVQHLSHLYIIELATKHVHVFFPFLSCNWLRALETPATLCGTTC